MSDETAEPHMAAAVTEIIKGNSWAEGDYLISAQATVTGDGHCLYTWRWAWSPKAPAHTGRADPP